VANFKLKINGLLGGERTWTVGWNCTSTSTGSTIATALHGAWNTFWGSAGSGFDAFVNAEVTTVSVSVSSQSATWRQIGLDTLALALAGTNAHDSLPWNSSLTVTHRSAVDAAYGRGRIELPCLANDKLTSHV
jgi:hypothetical protein